MYKIGTMFHGTAKSIGNIWIVYQDMSNEVALLFDGRSKGYCTDFGSTKKDKLSAYSLAIQVTSTELNSLTFLNGQLPQWAQDICNGNNPTQALTSGWTGYAPVPLPPAVVQKVQQALNIDLTESKEAVILRKDADRCPNGDYHKFVPYTGLRQMFEYCKECDAKREMPKV